MRGGGERKMRGGSGGIGVAIGEPKMRRIGLFLAVLVATMVGVVSSAAAGIRELGRPYRIGSNVLVFSPNGRWLATLDTLADGDPWPLQVMSVNTTTGRLHPARGAPFA